LLIIIKEKILGDNIKVKSYFVQSASISPPSLPAGKPRLTPCSLYGRTRQYFTGKGQDAETGLYYYGARYLDPRAARWAGGDPALGEYVPAAGRGSGGLPGMGGVYNTVNLHVYHYAGNNPVKYVDPDGRIIADVDGTMVQQDSTGQLGTENTTIYAEGCVLTAVTRIANAISGNSFTLEDVNQMALDNNLYSGAGGSLTVENQAVLIGLLTGENIVRQTISGNMGTTIIPALNELDASDTIYYVTGRMSITNSNGQSAGEHTVNIRGAASPTEITVRDTSNVNRTTTNGHIINIPLGTLMPEPINSIHIFSVGR
jgi:RHS repeat-associated protein